MKYFKRLAVAAFATAAFNLGASSLLQAQDAPPGDAFVQSLPGARSAKDISILND